MKRLDENNDEDVGGILNTISIIENLVEINDKVATEVCSRTNILCYCLSKLKSRKFDDIKFNVSELLSILLQSSQKCRYLLSNLVFKLEEENESFDAFDVLLQSIAPYRKRDPVAADEKVKERI